MSFRAEAILALVPNANFTLSNDEIFHWDSKNEIPSEDAIKAKEQELIEADKKLQYQRDRLQEYPDLQECIHAILDDDLTALQAKRKLVKDKYPKP